MVRVNPVVVMQDAPPSNFSVTPDGIVIFPVMAGTGIMEGTSITPVLPAQVTAWASVPKTTHVPLMFEAVMCWANAVPQNKRMAKQIFFME
jgi:hypothetical protein